MFEPICSTVRQNQIDNVLNFFFLQIKKKNCFFGESIWQRKNPKRETRQTKKKCELQREITKTWTTDRQNYNEIVPIDLEK